MKFLYLTVAVLAGTLASEAQTLTNDGAALTVQGGTTVFVQGSVLNKAGSTLVNDGTLQTTGDFTNVGTAAGAGLLRFSGTADQQLTPGTSSLYRVEVANTGTAGNNRVLLRGDLTVTNQVLLTSGLLRTDATATLSLPDGATLSGETSGCYVQGNLRVSRSAVNGLVDFGHGVKLDGTGQALGAVSITRTAGLQTTGLSYGQNLGATTKGIDRIWTVAPAAQPTAPVPLTLTWLTDDDNGLTSFAQASLWQSATSAEPWAAVGTPSDAAGRSITRSVSALNRFTVSNQQNPLPVELISFSAERRGADGLLRWATASEKNNDHFDVEASTDGVAFRRVGSVAGHGTITQAQNYAFTDANLARYAAEVVYYRLRQVDRDGTEAFSPVRHVQVPAPSGLAVEAFPTPLRPGDVTTLQVRSAEAGPVQVLITDALGRALSRQELLVPQGASSFTLPESARWSQGVYLLEIRQGTRHQVVKVVRE